MKEITTTPLFNLQYISLLISEIYAKHNKKLRILFFQATILSERSS